MTRMIRSRRRRHSLLPAVFLPAAAAACLALLAGAAPANAQLVIQAQFDSTITSDPNASEIEATINAGIAQIENTVTNSLTVQITYSEGGGLGESSTFYDNVSYTSFRAALAAETPTAIKTQALASLPNTTGNPVNDNADITVAEANAAILGLDSTVNGTNIGTVTLNTSICNLTRTSIDPTKYDLESVAMHETDEMLGIGGAGSELNYVDEGGQGLSDPPGPLDLYRYSASGVRSYTISSSSTAYFSVNGGVTDINGFNQNGMTDGSDFGDWATSATPHVQDAYATPGVIVNLGTPEYDMYQAVGWNLSSSLLTPAPGPLSVAGTCIFMAGCPAWLRRLRRRPVRPPLPASPPRTGER